MYLKCEFLLCLTLWRSLEFSRRLRTLTEMYPIRLMTPAGTNACE